MLYVRGPAQLSATWLLGDGAHSLEVATASLVYCVAAGEDGEAWAHAIRQALMPIEESGRAEEIQGERANRPIPSACENTRWGGGAESKL